MEEYPDERHSISKHNLSIPTYHLNDRDLPLHTAGYEVVKELLLLRHPENDRYPRTMDLLMAGGIAGQLGWISCYPQDVIKSRIQARENGPVRTYRTIREMWSGPGGGILGRVWWVGFGTTMIRAFPANAATFLAYERCMEWLRGSRGEWD